jgi:hypothetical protein
MRQKEEMYNEKGTRVGGGAARQESDEKGYSKYLFLAAAVAIIVAGVVLAIING